MLSASPVPDSPAVPPARAGIAVLEGGSVGLVVAAALRPGGRAGGECGGGAVALVVGFAARLAHASAEGAGAKALIVGVAASARIGKVAANPPEARLPEPEARVPCQPSVPKVEF